MPSHVTQMVKRVTFSCKGSVFQAGNHNYLLRFAFLSSNLSFFTASFFTNSVFLSFSSFSFVLASAFLMYSILLAPVRW